MNIKFCGGIIPPKFCGGEEGQFSHVTDKMKRSFFQAAVLSICEDPGCSLEDLPEAMNDREKWRERVRDIRAGGST